MGHNNKKKNNNKKKQKKSSNSHNNQQQKQQQKKNEKPTKPASGFDPTKSIKAALESKVVNPIECESGALAVFIEFLASGQLLDCKTMEKTLPLTVKDLQSGRILPQELYDHFVTTLYDKHFPMYEQIYTTQKAVQANRYEMVQLITAALVPMVLEKVKETREYQRRKTKIGRAGNEVCTRFERALHLGVKDIMQKSGGANIMGMGHHEMAKPVAIYRNAIHQVAEAFAPQMDQIYFFNRHETTTFLASCRLYNCDLKEYFNICDGLFGDTPHAKQMEQDKQTKLRKDCLLEVTQALANDYDNAHKRCWACHKLEPTTCAAVTDDNNNTNTKTQACCSQCKVAHYCNANCQLAGWKGGHQHSCAGIQELYKLHCHNLNLIQAAQEYKIQEEKEQNRELAKLAQELKQTNKPRNFRSRIRPIDMDDDVFDSLYGGEEKKEEKEKEQPKEDYFGAKKKLDKKEKDKSLIHLIDPTTTVLPYVCNEVSDYTIFQTIANSLSFPNAFQMELQQQQQLLTNDDTIMQAMLQLQPSMLHFYHNLQRIEKDVQCWIFPQDFQQYDEHTLVATYLKTLFTDCKTQDQAHDKEAVLFAAHARLLCFDLNTLAQILLENNSKKKQSTSSWLLSSLSSILDDDDNSKKQMPWDKLGPLFLPEQATNPLPRRRFIELYRKKTSTLLSHSVDKDVARYRRMKRNMALREFREAHHQETWAS